MSSSFAPRPALLAAFALNAASASFALTIYDYDSATNERFTSGFSSGSPVANSSPAFTLAGYDLSGVGWRNNSKEIAVTLVSPEHFVTAAHVAPAVNSTVSFLGSDGLVRSYTVGSVTTFQFNGNNTDLSLGRLTAVVDTAHITSYAGLFLGNTAGDYANLPVTLYGANGRVGTNTVDVVGAADLLPFGHLDLQPADSVISIMDFDPVTGEAQAQGGDSGSPTFVRIAGNQLALFGIHSAINSAPPPHQTYDSLPLLTNYDLINNALISAGYQGWGYYTGNVVAPSPVPEPASAAVLLGLAALGAATRRRRA